MKDPLFNPSFLVLMSIALIFPTLGIVGLIREVYLAKILRRKMRKKRLILFSVILFIGAAAMVWPV